MADDRKDKGIVLIVDEKHIMEGLGMLLENRGITADYLDPTEDFTRQTDQYKLKAVIYEPYFVMCREGKRFRPIVDKILERAKKNNALRIALSSQNQEDLKEEGFIEGEHYTKYIRKPVRFDVILKSILNP